MSRRTSCRSGRARARRVSVRRVFERRVDPLLEVDGVEESVVYAIVLGGDQ